MGTASVSSDTIAYEKTLYTNTSHELQWFLSKSDTLSITNGISLNTMSPPKPADYDVLFDMLNHLKTNQSTVKVNLLKVINANLQTILAEKVLIDPVSTSLFRLKNLRKLSSIHIPIIMAIFR